MQWLRKDPKGGTERAGCQGNQPGIEVPTFKSTLSGSGESKLSLTQSPVADDSIKHTYVIMKPPQKLKRKGFGEPPLQTCRNLGRVVNSKRAWKLCPLFFLIFWFFFDFVSSFLPWSPPASLMFFPPTLSRLQKRKGYVILTTDHSFGEIHCFVTLHWISNNEQVF